MSKEGYKSHRPGTRKGIVHKIFDEKGDEAAMKKALSLDLAKGTVYSWFSEWRNPKKAAKSAKKAKGTKRAKVAKKAKSAKRAKVTKTAKRAKVSKPRATISTEASAAA